VAKLETVGVAKTTGGHVRPPPLQIFVKALPNRLDDWLDRNSTAG
jgi:hypothetical protein